jgi:uncharacterized protein involved in cysteine biosynthesis
MANNLKHELEGLFSELSKVGNVIGSVLSQISDETYEKMSEEDKAKLDEQVTELQKAKQRLSSEMSKINLNA